MNPSKPCTVRDAARSDVATLLQFIHELAAYEKLSHEVVADEAGLAENLFGPKAKAYALIAEQAGEAVGFALYFYNFSTFLGKPGLYLEDLYVRESHRGQGIGKALLRHLAQIAVAEGAERLDWWVLDWNQPAIEIYRALGAKPMEEWTVYRLTGEALQSFASARETA